MTASRLSARETTQRRWSLTYPVLVTGVVLGIVGLVGVVVRAPDQRSAIITAGLLVLVASVVKFTLAHHIPTGLPTGKIPVHRIRQQHRLSSRSWLEFHRDDGTHWFPVFFDPVLLDPTATELTVTENALYLGNQRIYPAGGIRDSEPPGKLIDNPTKPHPPSRLAAVTRPRRRLLLDAQAAVAAPFAGLLWVWVLGGGMTTFLGSTCALAAIGLWISVIRGGDPS